MANTDHLAHLKLGVEHWNEWRRPPNRNIEPDLRRADLGGADLIHADLAGADLTGAKLGGAYLSRANFKRADLRLANLVEANLSEANLTKARLNQAHLNKAYLNGADLTQTDLTDATLCGANLGGANLSRADLSRANLFQANLTGATLTGAKLTGAKLTAAYLTAANLDGAAQLDGADLDQATLTRTNLNGANLIGATLTGATLIGTQLERANLSGCNIYGIAAWNVNLRDAIQRNLRITPPDEPAIQVDNLDVAQFIYLLLNNENVRHIIDAVTSKVVLILGRFTEERKAVLDAIREQLRRCDLTPILFDFAKPASKDVTGTVETIARLARFIIADLTDPSSIPHELGTIVPFLRTTPVLPLRLVGSSGYSIFDNLSAYPWVLKVHDYKDGPSLISTLPDVIAPANDMAEKLRKEP